MFHSPLSLLLLLPAIAEYLGFTASHTKFFKAPENALEEGDVRAPESLIWSLTATIGENAPRNHNETFNSSERSNHSGVEPSKNSLTRDLKLRAQERLKNFKAFLQSGQFADIARNTRGAFMQDLLRQYKESEMEFDKIVILEKMKENLHEYATAENFAQTGGLTELLNNLSRLSPPLKTMILQCLAAAIQGCAHVKEIMFEARILEKMNTLWREELSNQSPNPKFLADCLLVVSSMLRNYPTAQNAFFSEQTETGDLVVFSLLLRTTESSAWNCYDKYCRRLKFRIFRLLGDLIDERNLLDDTPLERRKVYSKFDLPAEIKEHGWCHRVVRLVLDDQLLNTHVNVESAIEAGKEIAQACSQKDFFTDHQESLTLASRLEVLETKYDDLARTDTEDGLGYYEKVRSLVADFRKAVYGNGSVVSVASTHV